MVYSYTQISQYLRCPRSYRYRYMDGWQKKKLARPWLSAAVLRLLWELTSAKRTVERRSFANGGLIATQLSITRRERPGIACYIRESICSKDSLRTIASEFPTLIRFCK